MNNLRFLLFATLFLGAKEMVAQTITTESKSCGACHQPVSNYSTVGMRCPHCGVKWGRENTTQSTTTRERNYYDDSYKKTSGYTKANVNLRSEPSTYSSIKKLLPPFTHLEIHWRTGNWYYVTYKEWNGYYTEEISGYVYRPLIN